MWRAAVSVGMAFSVGGGALGLLSGVLRTHAESAALGIMGLSLLLVSQWTGARRRSRLQSETLRYPGALTPLAR
jgi:hypothetical protein